MAWPAWISRRITGCLLAWERRGGRRPDWRSPKRNGPRWARWARWARRRGGGHRAGAGASAQALAQRCRIVLACADGKDSREVAAGLRVHQVTAGKWRSRFIGPAWTGLGTRTGPGGARSVTLDQAGA